MEKKTNTTPTIVKKPLITVLIVVLLLGAGSAAVIHFRNDDTAKNAQQSTSSRSNPTATTSHTGTTADSADHKLNPDVPTPTPNPNVPGGTNESAGPSTLQSPNGTFVSNHHPSLSASAQETSECATLPSATCVITFAKGGVTKKLDAKVADNTGAASWAWTLQSVGLTQGSWQVSAVATFNGTSKTTVDQLTLEVQP